MTRLLLAIALGVGSLAAMSAAEPRPDAWPGVASLQRGEENYMLQCRGCHRPDGSGSPDTTPSLAGTVASFLKIDGGRQYLGQVPGVATAPLDDAELAELLNWTLFRFDRANIPSNFVAFTAVEVGRLRHTPLRTEAPRIRAQLIRELERMPRHVP